MGVRRLIHLNVVCSDLDRSLAFYQDVVGATMVLPFANQEDDFLGSIGDPGGSGHRGAMLCLGDNRRGPYIDLIEWDRKGKEGGLGPRDIGVPRIAILVDDVDESYGEVQERGGQPLGEPVDLNVGDQRVRCFVFPDPDGFLVEFVQFLET